MFSLVIRVIFGWMVILGVIKRKKINKKSRCIMFVYFVIYFLVKCDCFKLRNKILKKILFNLIVFYLLYVR